MWGILLSPASKWPEPWTPVAETWCRWRATVTDCSFPCTATVKARSQSWCMQRCCISTSLCIFPQLSKSRSAASHNLIKKKKVLSSIKKTIYIDSVFMFGLFSYSPRLQYLEFSMKCYMSIYIYI